jgi:hypothetical protein
MSVCSVGFRRVALVALALALLPPEASAGAPDPGVERVAVLDAGTFLVVEVNQATIGEVLQRLAAHLKTELVNTNQLDLDRVIDGRKSGSLIEVIRWLVPEGGFIVISNQPEPGDPHLPKPLRITFLRPGAATPSDIANAVVGKPVDPAEVKSPQYAAPSASARSAANGVSRQSGPSDADLAAGKPDIPSTPKSEIKSVAEQLEAQTPLAQLAIEAAAHDPMGQSPPPAFLAPQSDVAQLTLEQQMERSQALAVEQLGALMRAYRAAQQGGRR